MNKFFQRLFLFKKFEIRTELSKQQILDMIKSYADAEYTDYYAGISKCGFFVGERFIKHYGFIRTRNSFAPVAKAKITEKDSINTISIVVRMHLLILILFAPLYLMSLLTIVLFPFVLLFLHFTFVKPMNRLKQEIEDLFAGMYPKVKSHDNNSADNSKKETFTQ